VSLTAVVRGALPGRRKSGAGGTSVIWHKTLRYRKPSSVPS